MALFRFKNSELVAMAFFWELQEMKVMWRSSPLLEGTIAAVWGYL